MQISNHLIPGLKMENFRQRDALVDPKFVAVHYTAGGDIDSSIAHLKSLGYGYHILIDRDGTVIQGAPFNVGVNHAGCSNYAGFEQFNDNSIGICLANYGYLDLQDDDNGHYFRSDLPDVELFEDDIIKSRHYTGGNVMAWEKYTEAQQKSLFDVCKLLREAYPSLMAIVGHDEIAVGRKLDPGPALNYTDVYTLFPNPDILTASTRYVVDSPDGLLNLRRGRSSRWSIIKTLQNGDVVYVRGKEHFFRNKQCSIGSWASVALEKDMFHSGFVAWRFLKKEMQPIEDLV